MALTLEKIMGITYVEGTVTGSTGKQSSAQFLLDSGAKYTLLPEPIWKAVELSAKRRMIFTLADGTHIERDVSEVQIALPQGDGHTPVILGQPGDEALSGAVTLEELGLALNPFQRSLQPARMMLA
jgi:aspartyl protease family protein